MTHWKFEHPGHRKIFCAIISPLIDSKGNKCDIRSVSFIRDGMKVFHDGNLYDHCTFFARCLRQERASYFALAPSLFGKYLVSGTIHARFLNQEGIVYSKVDELSLPEQEEFFECMGNGGGSGIRTHGTRLTYTRFPSVLLKPLGHPSTKQKE